MTVSYLASSPYYSTRNINNRLDNVDKRLNNERKKDLRFKQTFVGLLIIIIIS